MRRIRMILLAAVTALFLSLSSAGALTVTDMKGRDITLDAPATRIVALSAADCEILCALGAEALLVGRGEYCNYPDTLQALPVVNSGAGTNLEQVLALAPQVVLMNTMAQTVEQVQALENAGIRVVVSEATDMAGVYEAMAMIGAICGKDAEASALAAQMQADFADIHAQAPQDGKTVYIEVSALQYGLWTAGAGTFLDELAKICGLTNAFPDMTGWGEISAEQVLARNPDYIVTTSMYFGEGPTPAEEILSREGWQDVPAIQHGCVFEVDADMSSRPGPRLTLAAQRLLSMLLENQ